jgi:hypothetical protein
MGSFPVFEYGDYDGMTPDFWNNYGLKGLVHDALQFCEDNFLNILEECWWYVIRSSRPFCLHTPDCFFQLMHLEVFALCRFPPLNLAG